MHTNYLSKKSNAYPVGIDEAFRQSLLKWLMIKPQTSDIRVHTSDMQMTYEYKQIIYEYMRATYEWHMSEIQMKY